MRIRLIFAAVVALASLGLTTYDKVKETLAVQFGMMTSGEAQPTGHSPGHTSGHLELQPSTQHDEVGAQAEGAQTDGEHHAKHKIVVTSPVAKDVMLTRQYVCQIHSRRHIDVCALEGGYLAKININEGQAVKQGDVMFHILPTLYQAKRDADVAEAQLAQVEYDNTLKLVQQGILSDQALKLAKAKLAKTQAQVDLAQAEVNFADIRAPFDGIVDRLREQQGSLIEEGAMLTTLSDNSVMWVYFNVPEARYLEYQAALIEDPGQMALDVDLVLANHQKFSESGKIGAIEADFNNKTGNIAFRADFENPQGLLRHGQTGTVLINRVSKNATVIPQRATFEILAKKYAFVIDSDNIVHQREIVIQNKKEDIFVVASGLEVGDKIILEGIRQVRDGEHVEYEYREPNEVLARLKNHAE